MTYILINRTGTLHLGSGNASRCNHSGSVRKLPSYRKATMEAASRALSSESSKWCRKCFPNGKPSINDLYRLVSEA